MNQVKMAAEESNEGAARTIDSKDMTQQNKALDSLEDKQFNSMRVHEVIALNKQWIFHNWTLLKGMLFVKQEKMGKRFILLTIELPEEETEEPRKYKGEAKPMEISLEVGISLEPDNKSSGTDGDSNCLQSCLLLPNVDGPSPEKINYFPWGTLPTLGKQLGSFPSFKQPLSPAYVQDKWPSVSSKSNNSE